MAINPARRWIKKDLAARQQVIRDFYVTGDAKTAASFLKMIKAPKGYGIYASVGPRIQYGIYGRDSVEVAEDLLSTNPRLVHEILLQLAALQGLRNDNRTEEEPGKIHHEYRRDYFNGHRISRAAQFVIAQARRTTGRPHEPLLYYGSFDSTPLFIRIVHRYVRDHGQGVLNERVKGKDGLVRPFSEHVHMATEWLAGKVAASPWGLFESRPLNPKGLTNQEWEDSAEAYVHVSGAFANTADGVAALELQGYAYDALLAAAELVAADAEEAKMWRAMAARIQEHTLTMFWMPKQRYFCMGLDRHPKTGQRRQITTLNANGALILDSHLISDLPPRLRKQYIDGLADMIESDDFWTPAGPRIRALRHAGVITYADYHGSLVTWPKETYDIAKGFRRNGREDLALKLEDTILDAVAQAGEFYEFFLVNQDGRIKYHYRRENPGEPPIAGFSASVLPEAGQAWTISAVLAIVAHRHETQKETWPAPKAPNATPITPKNAPKSVS
jgi:glycogen debranching enzyme